MQFGNKYANFFLYKLNMNMEIQSSYHQTFTGYKSAFGKKLEKALSSQITTRKNADKLLNDFAKMYDKKICLDSKIGEGFYGSVFRIDDYYVLKRGNEYLEPEFGSIELVKKRKFAHLKHYFGEAIAKICNTVGEDMAILRNVYSKGKSIPVGIPDEFSRTHTKEEGIKYYHKTYMPTFAKLPQRSFDGIAKDFAQLNKMCTKRKSYFFDFLNPNNFVLSGKTLRILDEINEDMVTTKNCVTDMFEVFLNKMELDRYALFDEDLIPLRKELTKKLILAGARHNVPMCQSKTDLPPWVTTFNKLLGYKMSKNEFWDIIKSIENLKKNNKNPKKRVEAVKQYLEDVIGL